jgi:uncharacterized membrane protein YgcG
MGHYYQMLTLEFSGHYFASSAFAREQTPRADKKGRDSKDLKGLSESLRKCLTASHRHLTQEIKKELVVVFACSTQQRTISETCRNIAL